MKKDKLHTIKSTGYKTPDNYFNTFYDKLIRRTSKALIEDIETSGYTISTDYFESVEHKILNRIEKENDKLIIQLNTRKPIYYITSLAASILIALAIFVNWPSDNEISTDMVATYFEESDLSSYELAELLGEADLLEDDFTIIETPYKEDNIESYLLDNIDIEAYLE